MTGEPRTPLKLFISQRILTRYREDCFYELSQRPGIRLFVAFGDRSPRRPFPKYRSIEATPRFPHARLRTLSAIFERFGHVNQVFVSPGVLWRLLRQRPDVVLTEGSSNILNNFFVCSYCLVARRPYVWWDLGAIRGQARQNRFRRLLSPAIGFFLRRATVLLGYSQHSAAWFESLGLPASRVVVAGNTLRLDGHLACRAERGEAAAALGRALDLAGRFVVLAVGGLERAKGFDRLIRAFLALDAPEARLLIVGDGPERAALEAEAGAALNTRVLFAGAQHADLGLYFMNADLFCQPGLGGLAINEAMVHGLPVIAAPADGTELDLVREGETGFLVGRDAVDELTERLRWALAHPDRLREMGERGRRFVLEHYTLDHMVDRIVAALELATGIGDHGS